LWISICEHSGGPLPAHYLGIGLLGLRQLPAREAQPNDRPWMTGLANWAASRRPPLEAFQHEWWSLAAQYVRTRPLWSQAIDQTLRQQTARHMPTALQEFWRNDVGGSSALQTPRSVPRHAVRLPPVGHVEFILQRSAEPLKEIRPEIDRAIAERKRFAEVTGDSHFLVRSACNIGMRLLEASSEEEQVERGRLAERLARDAVVWEPDDPIPWPLWRDALEAQGKLRVAELVGWDAIRRFPEDPQRRTQLAKLISKMPARRSDAERLLREAAERFPNDVATLNQLVQFLAHTREGFEEARILLSRFDKSTPDLIGVAQLEALVDQPYAEISDPYPTLEAELVGGPDPLLVSVLSGGRQRRLAAWVRWYGAPSVLTEIQEVSERDPNSAYTLYLRNELRLDHADDNAPGLSPAEFGAAFVQALRDKDSTRLADLQAAFSDSEQIFDIARVFLFGDADAASRSAARLSERPIGETRQTTALRGFLGVRLGLLPEGKAWSVSPAEIIQLAANDNLAEDLMEVALTPWDTSLAA
jgi:hypothetical protein